MLVLVVVLLLSGLFLNKEKLPSPLIGTQLPHFSLPTLEEPENHVTEKDFTHEVALINIWASWCYSCRSEHDWLLKHTDLGVPVYGINYKDDSLKAMQWLKELGNPYKYNIIDKQGVLSLNLGVYGTPETYLIDSHGTIRYKHIGTLNNHVWNSQLLPIITKIKQES